MAEPQALPTVSAPSAKVWWFPSMAVLVFGLIFIAALRNGSAMMNTDGDLGRHLTLGRYILATGQIPTEDLFSHTMPGASLVPHEWLSEVLFALAERLAGLNGVVWLSALVLASVYTVLVVGTQRLGLRAPLALAAGLLAALTGVLHWLTRPHIFTLLLFTLFFLGLERYRRQGRWQTLVPLPFLMVVWVNLHGAFITGLILVLCYAAGAILERQPRRALTLGALLLALLLASLVNPVGPRLLVNSFGYLGDRYLVDMTQEYRSPNFHNLATWPFAALLLGSWALGWLARRRLAWTPLVVLGFWAAFGLYSARNIPLYALAAAPLLAWELESWLPEAWPGLGRLVQRLDVVDRRTWGWMWAVVVVAVGIGLEAAGRPLDFHKNGNRFDPDVFPVAAVDRLMLDLPAGHVFNQFEWGGYLLYRLWPAQRVFIDGQTDFYGPELTKEYNAVIHADPDWSEILDRYQVRWVILPADQPLNDLLACTEEWQLRYQDETAVVWQRP